MSALIVWIVGGVSVFVVLVIAIVVLCKRCRNNQALMQTQGGSNNRQIIIIPAGQAPIIPQATPKTHKPHNHTLKSTPILSTSAPTSLPATKLPTNL